MMKNRSFTVWAASAALASICAVDASARLIAWTAVQPPAIESKSLRGGGAWKTDGRAKKPAQDWDVDLSRDGNRLSGSINLGDSPLASAGRVDGTISGARVYGTVVDDAGREVLTFQGRILPTGLSGRYRDRTGERGTWNWEGQLPE